MGDRIERMVVEGQRFTVAGLLEEHKAGRFKPMDKADFMAFADAPEGSKMLNAHDEDYDINYTYILAPHKAEGVIHLECVAQVDGGGEYIYIATVDRGGIVTDWEQIG